MAGTRNVGTYIAISSHGGRDRVRSSKQSILGIAFSHKPVKNNDIREAVGIGGVG